MNKRNNEDRKIIKETIFAGMVILGMMAFFYLGMALACAIIYG